MCRRGVRAAGRGVQGCCRPTRCRPARDWTAADLLGHLGGVQRWAADDRGRRPHREPAGRRARAALFGRLPEGADPDPTVGARALLTLVRGGPPGLVGRAVRGAGGPAGHALPQERPAAAALLGPAAGARGDHPPGRHARRPARPDARRRARRRSTTTWRSTGSTSWSAASSRGGRRGCAPTSRSGWRSARPTPTARPGRSRSPADPPVTTLGADGRRGRRATRHGRGAVPRAVEPRRRHRRDRRRRRARSVARTRAGGLVLTGAPESHDRSGSEPATLRAARPEGGLGRPEGAQSSRDDAGVISARSWRNRNRPGAPAIGSYASSASATQAGTSSAGSRAVQSADPTVSHAAKASRDGKSHVRSLDLERAQFEPGAGDQRRIAVGVARARTARGSRRSSAPNARNRTPACATSSRLGRGPSHTCWTITRPPGTVTPRDAARAPRAGRPPSAAC